MFNGRSRGPKPSRCTHSSRQGFEAFFGRRSEPPPDVEAAVNANAEEPAGAASDAAACHWLSCGNGDGEPIAHQDEGSARGARR
eukprot:scaffold20765_cov23-Tisochrysis_lutea.AAC.1